MLPYNNFIYLYIKNIFSTVCLNIFVVIFKSCQIESNLTLILVSKSHTIGIWVWRLSKVRHKDHCCIQVRFNFDRQKTYYTIIFKPVLPESWTLNSAQKISSQTAQSGKSSSFRVAHFVVLAKLYLPTYINDSSQIHSLWVEAAHAQMVWGFCLLYFVMLQRHSMLSL